MQNTYAESFRLFLMCTDEKEQFVSWISEIIRENDARSLLDIGAGNGDLAIPLSKKVETYQAVESNPKHAFALRSYGLSVIDAKFPCHVHQYYDMVLISHSLPYLPHAYEPFILSAFSSLNTGGELVLVTYNDESSEWSDFVRECGLLWRKPEARRTASIHEFIAKRIPSVTCKERVTYVRSRKLLDIVQALGFVYSDGKEDMFRAFMESEAVKRLLEEKHRSSDGYSFPFTHYFFRARRS